MMYSPTTYFDLAFEFNQYALWSSYVKHVSRIYILEIYRLFVIAHVSRIPIVINDQIIKREQRKESMLINPRDINTLWLSLFIRKPDND